MEPIRLNTIEEAIADFNGGTRLLEVHAHHDDESVFELTLDGGKLFGVLTGATTFTAGGGQSDRESFYSHFTT